MIWPGMGDPAKRKQTLRFLAITAGIAIAVGVGSSIVQTQLSTSDPLKNCINNRDTPYKISATLELYVDGHKADIPANIGFEEGCQKSLYTISNDGTIYAEWEAEYPFEIGHFFWVWEFPLRDMEQSKSRIFVNGMESADFIHAPFVDGYHYKAEFTSKAYDASKDTDFLPPEN
ncbi:MAG: hypothetical protein FJ356_03685 [Thaumarchaeota archaeon]|nr:hypothetical protein [Nitrososphaerota archaeon]